ncbi:frequency clock protein [Rhodotorula toruloides]|uniref:Frequency clock protein n=1 Tax=Rhodotorula toruloides TaxID=5286 RepID=A0A511KHA8_RHOTO|nr:frequency clock protein [Rhodotorula toruloides]
MPFSGGYDGSSSSGKRVLHPALERVRLDTVGGVAHDRDSRGKARVADVAPSDSSASSVPRPAMQSVNVPQSSSSGPSRHVGSSVNPGTVSSTTRGLGALGIPLPSSDDEDLDAEPSSILSTDSLGGNPPGSPLVPIHEAQEVARYSRGGSTRSGPSTRNGEQFDGGAFVSEQSFRDIVDDLTLENQKLKARLKRFESARVPTNLRKERLFEVRFFDGLPKAKRREIESFLTDYVQSFSNSTSGDYTDSSRINTTGNSSSHDHTESTSSLGATLRSLRSSEKEALQVVVDPASRRESPTSGRSGSGSGSGSGKRTGSGDGTGSGGEKRKRRRLDSAAPSTVAPLGLISSVAFPDPPRLLRRPTDIFPPERDILAAPSAPPIETVSRMGTGSGIRITEPHSRKRRRTPAASPEAAATTPDRTRLQRSGSWEGSVGSSTGAPDPDRLGDLIVELIERLFFESLPVEGVAGPQIPPQNPLGSDPTPLPAKSSTNTQYLRNMLAADEITATGGWLYLNLVSTMAALHRLNVSVGTVRHALRSKSKLIEVSSDGTKIRWHGPSSKPLKQPGDVEQPDVQMGDMEDNSIEATRIEGAEEEERERKRDAHSRPSDSTATSDDGDVPESMFDERPGARYNANGSDSGQLLSGSRRSTAPTSQMPSGGSKNGSSSNSGTRGEKRSFASQGAGASAPARMQGSALTQPVKSSSLRHSVEEVSSSGGAVRSDGDGTTVEALGSTAVDGASKRVLYKPLFVRRNDSASEDDESASDGGSAGSKLKRKKIYDAGVVFFANDLFYSDLSGDTLSRTQLRLAQADDEHPSSRPFLGDSSSTGAEWTSAAATSRTRSEFTPMSESGGSIRSSRSQDKSAEDIEMAVEEPAIPTLDADAGWDGISSVHLLTCAPLPGKIDIFTVTPCPALHVSATGDVTAADHFTTHVKLRHSSIPSSIVRADLPKRLRPSFGSCLPATLASHKYVTPVIVPTYLATHTLDHHPAIRVRFPRLRLRLSSATSDSEDDEVSAAGWTGSPTSSQLRRLPAAGGGDYLMSLALPLNTWAPQTRRPTSSDERASEAVETGDSRITLD